MAEQILPLFPLNIVAFPGERLNLHIFEPRYKQLVNETVDKGTTFGIPTFMDNQPGEYGTEMKVLSIENRYPHGEMDIKTVGLRVFKILNFERIAPNKLYPQGNIQFIENIDDGDEMLVLDIAQKIEELYEALKIDKSFNDFKTFTIAHHIGLSVEQEVALLKIGSEGERQHFILDHLQKIVPVVIQTEQLKERVRMNGHFKNLKPPNF